MIYDIIGDIHGQADKLKGLLKQLGYVHNAQENGKGYFVPPENHQAVFIGDLIDRGKQELETLEIVFAMLDNGVARAVMGNHEYNALAFATADENNTSQYLRSHNDVHIAQHQAFLDEVGFDSELHHYWLSRFYQLPLWLELPEVCFVHACWDSKAMAVLQPLLTPNNCLTYPALQATGQKDSVEYNALERVLKGVETRLPNDLFMLDKEGTKRRNVRVKWWLAHSEKPLSNKLSGQRIHDIARATAKDLANIPHDTFADEIDFAFDNVKPVFIGHYWLTGTPAMLSDKVVCVDYSAAVDSGFLTAYQFDTENPSLSDKNFVQFKG